MQIKTNNSSSFPDQVVPDAEKATWEYGLSVARAIEGEWFRNSNNNGYRFASNYNDFHNLRLYARTRYAERIIRDIQIKEYNKAVKDTWGIDLAESEGGDDSPQTIDELSAHMQLNYKQSIELAEEELINQILDKNKYHLTKKRLNQDLTILGIGALKTSFNKSEGIRIEYVDPVNLVYSYTDDPHFEDIYYVGEVKSISLPELKKRFPDLSPEEVIKIQKFQGNTSYQRNWNGRQDSQSVQVLFFEYKTYTNQVFKIKETSSGLEKVLEKTDMFNPPEADTFKRVSRSIEVLYTGAKILGHEQMLEWKLAENMTRPDANTVKVNMNYSITAPRMYKGKIESLVSRITGFADMIQLAHLKLQQVLSRMVPDGVYLDMDGLAEVDLGNGTNYNPAEALNMYFQTGSIVGRSLTQEGELNHGKIPIQELQSSSGGAKIQSLIQTYQYYLQMIRDVTGLNEARDGSTPDKNALVGLQKLAAANSNTATRHILQAGLYVTLKICENITLRVGDALMFPLTRMALQDSISVYNVATLDEVSRASLHDFGIFLELEPDEEDKALLEQNVQMALQTQSIDLEDAIDIRNINNLKLANELLKKRRTLKSKKDQEIQQANIQMQAQANAEAAERAAMAEVQKQQILTESTLQIEQGKSQFAIQKLQQEAELKKQLMELEFQFNMQLARAQSDNKRSDETQKEDRKDERTKIQATQQSELIDQRKNDLLPKDFESKGFDNLGGFGLEQFAPR